MRTNWRTVVALAVLTLAGAIVGPPRAATTERLTKGELAIQMARAAGMALPPQGDERAAARALRQAGIDVGDDLGSAATESTLARVGRAIGLDVRTSRPGSPTTPGLTRAFVQSITGSLKAAAAASGRSGTDSAHVSCQGRESREARKGTPASASNINAVAPPCEEPVP